MQRECRWSASVSVRGGRGRGRGRGRGGTPVEVVGREVAVAASEATRAPEVRERAAAHRERRVARRVERLVQPLEVCAHTRGALSQERSTSTRIDLEARQDPAAVPLDFLLTHSTQHPHARRNLLSHKKRFALASLTRSSRKGD